MSVHVVINIRMKGERVVECNMPLPVIGRSFFCMFSVSCIFILSSYFCYVFMSVAFSLSCMMSSLIYIMSLYSVHVCI